MAIKDKQKNSTAMRFWQAMLDYILVLIGTIIFAFSVYVFTVPANIAPGGVTGISTIINHVSSLSVGTLYTLINIPLLIIGFIMLSKRLMIRTLLSVVAFTAVYDYVFPLFMPVFQGEGILSSLYGGILLGIGLGIVYSKDSTTGGTDIINRIILKFFPHFKIGQITFVTDAIVILIAMLVFKNINAGLYAIIVIYAQGQVIDKLVYGGYEAKMLMIFTDKPDEISRKIIEIGRGVTSVQGKGAFSGNDKKVLYTVIHKNQYFKLKRLVKEIDSSAFLVVSSVNEVLGEGFKEFEN